ncbi:hypothetical protein ASD11_15175 [Aeromicrobium sp. Root495]|nr:hypothetical protein ASD11_15175 [Aeromicrobium sp. Root495]
MQLEPRHNNESELRDLITSLAGVAQRRMSRTRALKGKVTHVVAASRELLQVTIEDVTFSLAGGTDSEAELAETLLQTVKAALETGHAGFALLLDEAQAIRDDKDRGGEHPLSMLVATVNALQEAGLPIALVLCGLPTLRANLQKARTYSERMFKAENIAELTGNPGPARDAFVVPLEGTGVTADDDLIARVLDEVEGYPFFIQLWGAELWEAAKDVGRAHFDITMLDAIEGQIYERLDEEFYVGRIEALTPSEQDLLLLSEECPYPPLRTADLRARSDKSQGNINVLMGRLTEQGVLYRIQNGQYGYTAPKFAEYLARRKASMQQ